MSSASAGWQVHSLNNLSLFGQVVLDSQQIGALPKRIRDTIFAGYATVLNQLHTAPKSKNIQFAAKTTPDGCLSVSYDGGVNYQEAGSLQDFPKLARAMRQACDAARIQFPQAFQEKKPIAMASCEIHAGSSWFSEARSVGLDINSLVRNSLSAAKIGYPFVALSGMGSGTMGILVATDILREGKRRYDKACAIGDAEGKTQAELGMSTGLFYNLLSFGMVGAYLPSLYASFSTDPILSPQPGFYGALVEGSALAMSLTLIGSSLHEWKYITQFCESLGTILQREGASTQNKVIEGLEFLQQQLSLSEEDWGELRDKGLSSDRDAIQAKCLEKCDRLIRRVGPEVAAKIFQSRELLCNVIEGKVEAIQEAKELIELADLESFKKRVRAITSIVIATLGILAIGLSFALGADAHIISAINAGLWLTIDSGYLHNAIGKIAYQYFKPSEEKRWGPCTSEA